MKVKDLLSSHNRWTKGIMHEKVDNKGNYAYCLLGAIYECYDGHKRERVMERARVNLEDKGYPSITAFNDDQKTDHATVLKFVNALDI